MRPRRSLGQNFLQDESVVRRIVDSLELTDRDTVIEIGPGTGALTAELVKLAANVVAVEFDRDLIPILHQRFGGTGNLEIVNADALDVDLASLIGDLGTERSVKLAANLPYNISTPILQRLIEHRHLFFTITLMFQREVVERITATPGGKERGFLSVIAESAFTTEYLFDVAPSAFYPVPKVWSAVVRLTPRVNNIADEKQFRSIVSRSFAQKRKTLFNNLKSALPDAASVLESAGIEGRRRAETLTLDEWVRLTDTAVAMSKAG